MFEAQDLDTRDTRVTCPDCSDRELSARVRQEGRGELLHGHRLRDGIRVRGQQVPGPRTRRRPVRYEGKIFVNLEKYL